MYVTYEDVVARCAEDAASHAENRARREYETQSARTLEVAAIPGEPLSPRWRVRVQVPRPKFVWRGAPGGVHCAFRRGPDGRWRSVCLRFRHDTMADQRVQLPPLAKRCSDCASFLELRAAEARGTIDRA